MRGLKLDSRGKLALSESQIQKQIVEYLRAEGWIVRPAPRLGHQKRGGPVYEIPVGEPDLICVKWTGGVWDVLMIEVKASNGKLSKEQVLWAETHCPVFMVRSVDEIKRILAAGERA